MQKLKTAIIDIGSNTIRLAMYQYDKLALDIIHIHIVTRDRAVAEVYQAERTKKHIERVFKRQVVIHFSEERWK